MFDKPTALLRELSSGLLDCNEDGVYNKMISFEIIWKMDDLNPGL